MVIAYLVFPQHQCERISHTPLGVKRTFCVTIVAIEFHSFFRGGSHVIFLQWQTRHHEASCLIMSVRQVHTDIIRILVSFTQVECECSNLTLLRTHSVCAWLLWKFDYSHTFLCEVHTSFLTCSIGSYTLLKILHKQCVYTVWYLLSAEGWKSKTVSPESRKNYRHFWISSWSCKSIYIYNMYTRIWHKLIDAQNNKIIDNSYYLTGSKERHYYYQHHDLACKNKRDCLLMAWTKVNTSTTLYSRKKVQIVLGTWGMINHIHF